METLEVKKEKTSKAKQKSGNYPVLLPCWKYFFQKKWKQFSVIRAEPSCLFMMHCMITSKK